MENSFKQFLEEQAYLVNKNLSDFVKNKLIDTNLGNYNFKPLEKQYLKGLNILK